MVYNIGEMKKLRIFLGTLFSLSLIALTGCNITPESFWSGDNNVNHRYRPIKNISASDDEIRGWADSVSGSYEVLVLTDVHKGASYYKSGVDAAFEKWLNSYDLSKVKFALGLGDFADGAKEGQMKDYAALVSKIEAKGIKVLNVIGNHDLFQSDGYELYSKYCYPGTSYYKFYTKNLAWYGLDSGSGTLGSRQLEGLKAAMAVESKRVVVFTHVPLSRSELAQWFLPFCLRDTTERNILIQFFSEMEIQGYLCGHYHPGGVDKFGNFTQYNFKSFGENGVWYIMYVDEDAGSISYKEFN